MTENQQETVISQTEPGSCAAATCHSGGRPDILALGGALAIAAVLTFAGVCKLLGATHKELLLGTIPMDYAVGVCELLVSIYILVRHRCRYAWGLMAMLFGAFAGYSGYWTIVRGEPCGCFGKCWVPPQGVSMGIDIALALVALSLVFRRGGRAPMLITTAVAAGLCSWAGFSYAYHNSPQKAQELSGATAPDRLLGCDSLAEVREIESDGLAWLVFVHEEGCHVCEMYLADMQLHEVTLKENQDPYLRVRVISKAEAESQCGIETYAWESSPVAFTVRGGQVEQVWLGENLPFDIVYQLYSQQTGGAEYPY